jgi:hypothetical protein
MWGRAKISSPIAVLSPKSTDIKDIKRYVKIRREETILLFLPALLCAMRTERATQPPPSEGRARVPLLLLSLLLQLALQHRFDLVVNRDDESE